MKNQPKTLEDYGINVPSNRGGDVYVTCPQCSKDRRKKNAKCLSVNVDKGVWICHHCGWTGGIDDGARRGLADHWRKPDYRRPAPVVEKSSDKMMGWFAKRGIPEDVVRRNGIVTTTIYMPQVEEEVSAIAFPFKRGDETINHKYRDHAKNFRMDAGAERVLFGLNDIGPTTVIVEGEMDKLSMEVAGIPSCVSVPDGAPVPTAKDYSAKFDFLSADIERLSVVTKWIIAVDNDAAGQRLDDELSRRLGRENCMRVVWPDGCKDANEVLMKHGADALADCVINARPYPIAGVFEVMDLSDRITNLYTNGWESGSKTGWTDMDEYYTVRPGEFTVVTGIPNSGKSNWLDALCVNLADQQGWSFGIFSPENQPIEDHMARMIEKKLRKPFARGVHERMSPSDLEGGKEWAQEHFHWILPDDDTDWTIDSVLSAARQLVRRHGIRGLVIDPWNELEHQRPANLSETEYISQCLKRIRQFGRHNGVHIWVVAHPAKLYRDKQDGKYPIPTLYDISGSAHWRNKADNGVCVWRSFEEGNQIVQVHVQKIRFRQIGKLGMAELAYNHLTQTYHLPRNAATEIPPRYGRTG